MSRVLSFLKRVRLNRLLAAAIVSLVMLFSTACSRAGAADTAILKEPNNPNPTAQTQPYKGEINNFDDVDTTRVSKADVDTKAKALKDRVKRNINKKGIDRPGQYVEKFRSGAPLQERTESIANDAGQTANDVKKNLQQVGERSSKNLERSAKDATGQSSRLLDKTEQNTKAAAKDLSRDIKEQIYNAIDAAQRATN